MLQMKKSVIGMSISLLCVFGSAITLLSVIFLMIAVICKGQGIQQLILIHGYTIPIILMSLLFFLVFALFFAGFIGSIGFWVIGLTAIKKSGIAWYFWVDVFVFILSILAIVRGKPAASFPVWWVTHFVGYLLMKQQNID